MESICSECATELPPEGPSVKKLKKIFCRDCWIQYCDFRFRKRIFDFGKPTKGSNPNLLGPSEQVLIYYDGSPSSVALLNLVRDTVMACSAIKETQPQRTHLPFPFFLVCLVILESDTIGGPGAEGRQLKHLQDLQNWLQDTQTKLKIRLPFVVSSIELSITKFDYNKKKTTQIVVDQNEQCDLEVEIEQQENSNNSKVQVEIDKISLGNLRLPFDGVLNTQMGSILQNIKTKTSQKDFLDVVKYNLMVSAAMELRVSKILLPEDQTALAIKMFTLMSLGRGAQVAEQMGFITEEEEGIILARPLMDFSSDDLRQYLDCLPPECTAGLVNRSPKSRKMKIDTLGRQADEFIIDLQRGYPSTVSTLSRIGGKLKPSSWENVKCRRCKFCKRLEQQSDLDDLCYGCTNIFQDMKEPALFTELILLLAPSQEESGATTSTE